MVSLHSQLSDGPPNQHPEFAAENIHWIIITVEYEPAALVLLEKPSWVVQMPQTHRFVTTSGRAPGHVQNRRLFTVGDGITAGGQIVFRRVQHLATDHVVVLAQS
jgi:hypothetical protein